MHKHNQLKKNLSASKEEIKHAYEPSITFHDIYLKVQIFFHRLKIQFFF